MTGLYEFIVESNRIEGINRAPTNEEGVAHEYFMGHERITVSDVEAFVETVAKAPLRDKAGMNVRVGSYHPPPGGPLIRSLLRHLLGRISRGAISPYEGHLAYEALHPFMDGNGRSGRLIWAWQMHEKGLDPFALPFLHRFYYQALDASQK